MALVTILLQQNHYLKLESEVTKLSVRHQCEIGGGDVYMFLLGSTVAYFGWYWEIDVSDDDNEKPYL